MTPELCLTKDDCVRACIASLLEVDPSTVPNWFGDIPNDETTADKTIAANMAMQDWLAQRGLIASMRGYPGIMTLNELQFEIMRVYEWRYYMLWCNSGDEDHAVIGRGHEVAHNPAWYKKSIDGPMSNGFWLVWFIAKL